MIMLCCALLPLCKLCTCSFLMFMAHCHIHFMAMGKLSSWSEMISERILLHYSTYLTDYMQVNANNDEQLIVYSTFCVFSGRGTEWVPAMRLKWYLISISFLLNAPRTNHFAIFQQNHFKCHYSDLSNTSRIRTINNFNNNWHQKTC